MFTTFNMIKGELHKKNRSDLGLTWRWRREKEISQETKLFSQMLSVLLFSRFLQLPSRKESEDQPPKARQASGVYRFWLKSSSSSGLLRLLLFLLPGERSGSPQESLGLVACSAVRGEEARMLSIDLGQIRGYFVETLEGIFGANSHTCKHSPSSLTPPQIPNHHSYPHAYALFLPLLAQHAFSFHPTTSLHCNLKIVNYVDVVLRLSGTYKIHDLELGHVFMLFFYNVIVALIDSTLIDWGFQVTFSERSYKEEEFVHHLRERDPPEGPIPHLDARLCVLLSIVPLAIANVLKDDSDHNPSSVQVSMESEYRHEMKSDGSRKLGLISSVQVLGHFSGHLCPPTLVVDAANQAARKAVSFVYNSMNEKGESGTAIRANTNSVPRNISLKP
ncbi:hypothetical protein VNO77_23203 [Canavalia gladiata]|uniref:Uncharacterized protein n=1 Tax=Canavalia gladiata TaxID=3824 RepID=A0AAN9QF60_CANGL